MLIAVTGASGFIGSHVTIELARRGHRVRALGRSLRAPVAPGAEHIPVDYGDAGALARALDGADVVIHAAAATRAPTAEGLRAANVTVTQHVLDAARSVGSVTRFVLLSSQAAAGPAPSLDAPRTEDDAPAPIDAYGRSKLGAERLVADQTQVPWTVLRPAAVYGPRDRDFLQMFRLAARGVAIHPGNRAQWMSIVYVGDLVNGIMGATLQPAAIARTYFLGNDTPVQWAALFDAAALAAGRKLALDVELPWFLVNIGARLGDVHARLTGTASLLTSEKVALSRARFWVCSSERARREIGFAPAMSLERGFAETYRWYREKGWM